MLKQKPIQYSAPSAKWWSARKSTRVGQVGEDRRAWSIIQDGKNCLIVVSENVVLPNAR